MSQTKRKTSSLSLTIGSPANEESSSSNKARHSYSTLIQPLSIDPQRMQSPLKKQSGSACEAAPVFVKGLQNIRATKGQLVAFECRIRATPTFQVRWYRENNQIIDSADFRILRKKACLSLVPEEVCTLVITEAFPEDSGLFRCVAENEFGAVASSACLFVFPGTEEGLKTTAISETPSMMSITPAPKSQYWSNATPQMPAAGPANQVEHASSWWQNYGDESKDFCGMYENPSENLNYWSTLEQTRTSACTNSANSAE